MSYFENFVYCISAFIKVYSWGSSEYGQVGTNFKWGWWDCHRGMFVL